MADSRKQNPFEFSDLLQLQDVLSDFSLAEKALRSNSSVVLTDQGSWKYVLMTMTEYEHYLKAKSDEENRYELDQMPLLISGAGKRFFVDYYEQLRKTQEIKDPKFEHELANRQGWSLASLRSRISKARKIFDSGWEIDALRYIIDSPKTDTATRERAEMVLNKELYTDENAGLEANAKLSTPLAVPNFNHEEVTLMKLDNKSFAFKCIDLLIENDILDDSNIELLTDKDRCREKFNCSAFPILSEVSLTNELSDDDYKQSGRQRFYGTKIIIGNRAFVLTNHWYGPNKSMPDNRTPFLNWVYEQIKAKQNTRSK